MFSDLLNASVGKTHFATYVPPYAGRMIHKNRAYHGLVLNDPGVVRNYHFENGITLHTKGDYLFYLPKGSSYRVERVDENHEGCFAINFDFDREISVPPFMLAPRAAQSIRQAFRAADRAWNTHSAAAITSS